MARIRITSFVDEVFDHIWMLNRGGGIVEGEWVGERIHIEVIDKELKLSQ